MEVKAENLIPGKVYRIVISDCCVTDVIANAIFIKHDFEDDDINREYPTLYFDGIEFETIDRLTFFEVVYEQ